MKYLVSHQEQQLGPFELDELIEKVKSRELELFDYIFDESKNDWVLLLEHRDVSERLKSAKPTRPPESSSEVTPAPSPAPAAVTSAAADPHDIGDWYILKGEHKFGPFAYVDVVKMLQQKVVFPFDYVWHSGMDGWKRLAEMTDFGGEQIRTLFTKTETEKKEVFAQRRFKRQTFKGRVIIHDNLSLWDGQGFEISKGGVGLTMDNSLVVPGQRLFVHFKRDEDWPAFNAVCEVVSKTFVKDDTPIQYGLKFISMTQEVEDQFNKKVA